MKTSIDLYTSLCKCPLHQSTSLTKIGHTGLCTSVYYKPTDDRGFLLPIILPIQSTATTFFPEFSTDKFLPYLSGRQRLYRKGSRNTISSAGVCIQRSFFPCNIFSSVPFQITFFPFVPAFRRIIQLMRHQSFNTNSRPVIKQPKLILTYHPHGS